MPTPRIRVSAVDDKPASDDVAVAPARNNDTQPATGAEQAPRRAPDAHRRSASGGSARTRRAKATITSWRTYGVVAAAAVMVVGCLTGMLFFARPTSSAVEMRNLTPFPEFTAERFLNGSYFTDLSLWYADTYPLREPMVAADHAIDRLFGINTGTGLVGGNAQADSIPDQEGSGIDLNTPKLVEAPVEQALDADIQDNIMSGVYVTNGAAYSVFYFWQSAVDTYISAMNTAATNLDGVATVYTILAPANSITLPDEEAQKLGGSDQQQTLDYIDSRLDRRVKSVPLVDTVKEHRDEYLYFHTDHHWTQLGAYYAYVEFCKQKGIEPKQLSDWKHVDLGEFEGTFTETVASMGDVATDTIDAYIPSSTNTMTFINAEIGEQEGPVVNEDAVNWDVSAKYSAFAQGDQLFETIQNPELDDGSSCLVVKDSYGCVFIPLLVDHYQTVYVIDFRSTDKNICDFVRENNVQDVIFMTGMKIGLTETASAALLYEVSESTTSSDSSEPSE